jgi:hypothetical protein
MIPPNEGISCMQRAFPHLGVNPTNIDKKCGILEGAEINVMRRNV